MAVGALPQATGFVNLANIIQANQNNQLGNTIQNGVNQGISGLQSNVNQAQQQFNTAANAANNNTTGNQQTVSNAIASIVGSPAPANINAPQGQVAPTSSSTTQQPTTTTTPSTTSTSTGGVAGNFNFPVIKNVMATATPAPTTTTTPATSTASTTPPSLNAVPGSFGYMSNYASNPTAGSTSFSNTNPAPVTVPQGTVSNFANYLQGGYTGPNQLANYNTLAAQAQGLQSQAQDIGTQGGLQSLLQNYVGSPGYNQGEQTLDTILLGATGKPQLQNIAQSLQNVGNIPTQAEAQAVAQAQNTALGNQQFAQNVQNQLAAAQSPILGNIQSNLNNINTQNQSNEAIGQQIYNLLNNANAPGTTTTTPNSNGPGITIGNRIGGGAAAPTTDIGAANQAVQLASQNGFIDPTMTSYLNQLIAQGQNSPGNAAAGDALKEALSQAFNFNSTLPSYSLQQGANAQQAAQLNALEQLAGGAQQFGTYGGATPVTYGFDTTKLPALAGYTPSEVAAPTTTTTVVPDPQFGTQTW